MNTKILETLEFNKIKALFEPHLLTEQGLEELKLLRWIRSNKPLQRWRKCKPYLWSNLTFPY
jgi:dsDNA-specific endonuclease/ATPase MutS2